MSVNMLLISGAVKAGTSKTGKKIITAIASCLVIIVFLLIAFTTNVLSIFLNVGHVDLNNFDAKGTPIYQEIRSMYDDFVDDQKEEIKDLKQQIHDDNMVYTTELVYNPVTKKYEEKEREYCKAEITTDYRYLQTAYVMAYLSIKNSKDYINNKTKIAVDEDELFGFWNQVSTIVVDANEEDENAPTYHMSYKDASVYRSEQKKQIKEVESVRRQKIKIRATQHRAGATHCAIMTAYTLRKSGYLVALADLSESRDYQSIMRSYDRDDSQGFFTLFDIDIYLSMDTLVEQDYQFIVYDCGVHVNDIDADKNIIITGSKPWELIPLQRTLQAIKDIDAYLFLFNYTDPELEEDVKNMMKDVGVNDDKVFFLEMQSYLKESNVMRKIINVSDSEKKPKKKTWIFGKGR